MNRLLLRFAHLRHFIRELTGEDAYERYLAHWQEHHRAEGAPLDRKTFFEQHLDRKWNGINRCC